MAGQIAPLLLDDTPAGSGCALQVQRTYVAGAKQHPLLARDPEVLINEIGIPDHEVALGKDAPDLVLAERLRNGQGRLYSVHRRRGKTERGKIAVREHGDRPRRDRAVWCLDTVVREACCRRALKNPNALALECVPERTAVAVRIYAKCPAIADAAVVTRRADDCLD